jgi:hypothetical protein
MIKKQVFLCAVLAVNVCFGILPDRVMVEVEDVTGDGAVDTLILVKRSLRGPDYRVMSYDKASDSYKQVPTPEVRTYRGYVKDDRSMLVNAVIEPGNKLQAFLSDGRSLNARIEGREVDIQGEPGTADPGSRNRPAPYKVSRQSPTKEGYVVPKYTMRKMSVGVDIAHDYYVGMGEDLEAAVARVESRINDSDFFYARDMGIAWEIQECVVRVNGEPRNWKKWWTDETKVYINSKMKFKWPGGGGSSGRVFNSDTTDHQHTCSLGSGAAYSRSLGHEISHGFGGGHASSWEDTMGGSRSCLGVSTVQRMIDHSHVAKKNAAPAIVYGAPLTPYAMEDGFITKQDIPVKVNLLENDYDGNGDSIALGYIESPTCKGATVEMLSSGVVRYTPPKGFLGMDEFAYHVVDSGGLTNRHGYAKVYVHNGGLATHLLFDETSGTVVHDFGAFQSHGLLKDGLSFGSAVPGRIGGALMRDAANPASRVECEGTGDPMQGDLSVSLWVKYPERPSADGVLACKGGAVIPSRINNPRGGWFMGHLKNGTFRFGGNLQRDLSGGVEENSEKFDRHSTKPIKPDQWYHLVLVLDRSEQTLRAWVDNVEQTASEWSTVVPDGIIESSHAPLVLFDTESQHTQGTDTPCALDDFRVYYKALSKQEIGQLYAAKGEIAAGAPSPANGERKAMAGGTLQWMPGKPTPAYQFDVYLGTTEAAVAAASPTSPEYKGRQTAASLTPESVADTAYFWRVDEVTAAGKTVPGHVWRFYTGGRALFNPPLQNASFEEQRVSAGAQSKSIQGWHDSVGYTFTVNDNTEEYPDTPAGDQWAELDRSRWMYQQIGYYTENRDLEIRFLHGKKADKNAHAVVVSLYAGGNPDAAADQNLKIKDRNPLESGLGAMQVAKSKPISAPSGSSDAVEKRKVRLSTGTGHAVGEPLWLLIHTKENTGRTLIDDVQVLDVTDR